VFPREINRIRALRFIRISSAVAPSFNGGESFAIRESLCICPLYVLNVYLVWASGHGSNNRV
jgi:hypothetical protein